MPQLTAMRRLPLGEGASVLVRHASAADTELVRSAFERATSDSCGRRFSATVSRLSDRPRRHAPEHSETLIAMDPDSKEAVGVARMVCNGREVAGEIAVASVWRNTELGTALLEQLADSSAIPTA